MTQEKMDEKEKEIVEMTMEEIEVWWNNKPEVDKLLKRPIFGHWEDITNWLIHRVKELEEEIEKVLKWRNFDGDGITDPLRKELKELVEKK